MQCRSAVQTTKSEGGRRQGSFVTLPCVCSTAPSGILLICVSWLLWQQLLKWSTDSLFIRLQCCSISLVKTRGSVLCSLLWSPFQCPASQRKAPWKYLRSLQRGETGIPISKIESSSQLQQQQHFQSYLPNNFALHHFLAPGHGQTLAVSEEIRMKQNEDEHPQHLSTCLSVQGSSGNFHCHIVRQQIMTIIEKTK